MTDKHHIQPQSDTFAVGQLDQAKVRVAIVGSVVGFCLVLTLALDLGFQPPPTFLIIVSAYFLISLALFAWAWRSLKKQATRRELYYKQFAYPVIDLGVTTAMMATMGPHGGILLPVYLQVTIGNGIRSGKQALLFSQGLCLAGFTYVVATVPFWQEQTALTVGAYIGLALIPLYILNLLNRLNQTLEDLKHTNEARSRFIANMSHELRTPLHAITSTSDLLKERFRGDRDNLDLLRMISSSADHLLTMVNQVLDVAKLDSGSMPVHTEVFDLHERLRRVRDIVSPNALAKGLDFRLAVDADLPQHIEGSSDFLTQILVNLLGNAVKFTESGHVALSLTLVRDPLAPMLCIEVDDTGIGMSESALANIYKPFIQAEDDISRRFGGTGLGLTIVSELVRLCGGTIDCQSAPGIGTNFSVRLPLAIPALSADEIDNRPREMVYVTRGTPADDEVEALRAAGFRTRFVGLDRAAREIDELARHGDVPVVVDARSFGPKTQEIGEKLVRDRAPTMHLMVRLAGPGTTSEAPSGPFQVRVHDGMPDRWRRARAILDALFLEVETEIDAPQEAGGSFRVLVADDNLANRRTATLALEAVGHTVTAVCDGEEALDALEHGEFDLALMDMHMPNMDGLEAARLYRYIAHDDPTPIVMLTADVTDDAREAAARAAVAGFVLKPAGAKELRATVQRFARRASGRAPAAPPAPVAAAPPSPAFREAERTPPLPTGEGGRVVPLTDALVDGKELRELLQCGSTAEELKTLVDEFVSDARSQIEQTALCYRQARWGEAREVIHSLKGSAGVIGATAMYKRAARLEKMKLDELVERAEGEALELATLVDRTHPALLAVLGYAVPDATPERYSDSAS